MRALVIGPLIVLAVATGGRAWATCPPSAQVQGDPALIAEVSRALVDRGIASEISGCPSTFVRLERHDDLIAVSIAVSSGQTIERGVTDTRTAATLIESWARTDVEAPLLAAHDRKDNDGGDGDNDRAPKDDAPPPTAPSDIAVLAAEPAPPVPAAGRGVQLFGLTETSLASDGTRWLGAQFGACIMLGPLCAAARLRFATVVGGTEDWRADLDRHSVELLLGADLPLRFGRATFSPGLAAGIGWTHTHEEDSPRGGETGGLRAEAHASVAYPFSRRLAAEVALTIAVTQATPVETSSPIPLPDEPRFLTRLGAGLRFGGL
ncbi:MAG TPA: hypothetical protein VGP07_13140 [Polyangia bacterium]|jgi:hypothetical protein